MDAKILMTIIDEMISQSEKSEKNEKSKSKILELNKKFRVELEKQ